MAIETIYIPKRSTKPLIVFVHGMGMDVRGWAEPSAARVLGGKYPIDALLNKRDGRLRTAFQDLSERCYPVLSWSQSRPVGPIAASVDELCGLLAAYERASPAGIVIVAHSRGGLVARKALEEQGRGVRALVTIATPHLGSTMARWATFLSPLAAVVNQVLEGQQRREMRSAFQRVVGFLCSEGLQELLPHTPFLRSLSVRAQESICCHSVGGTSPHLLRIRGISVSDLAARVLPAPTLPEELREGYGDGLVSARSSIMPQSNTHRDFPLNHLEVLFDGAARDHIVALVQTLT